MARGKRKASSAASSSDPVTAKKSSSGIDQEEKENKNHPEELTCDVCTELYNEPKLLECFHTFCNGCIDKIQKHSNDKEVKCPKCRHVTKVYMADLSPYQVKVYNG